MDEQERPDAQNQEPEVEPLSDAVEDLAPAETETERVQGGAGKANMQDL